MKHNQKRMQAGLLALCLAAVTLFGGCMAGAPSSGTEGSGSALSPSSAPAADDGAYITPEQLFSGVQRRRQDTEEAVYSEPMAGLARNERIELALGFDLKSAGLEKYTEVANLFWDKELTQPVDFRYEYDESKKVLTLKPGPYSSGSIYTSSLTTAEVRKYPHDTISLFSRGAYEDWGNVGKFYMAEYLDLETGEKLETPSVRVVATKGELQAPQIEFRPTETGLAGFRWNAVEGATGYIVFRADYDEERGYGTTGVTPIALTSETSWTETAPLFSSYSQANGNFRWFRYSEDDWAGDNIYDKEGLAEGKAVIDDTRNYRYGVMAINETGSSVFSNLYSIEDLAPNLAYAEATYTSKNNGFTNDCEDIGLAPSHVWVTMCDGATARRLIQYDTEHARVETNRYINVDEDSGEYAGGEDLEVLQIPYTVEGAPFEYVLNVVDYDESTIDADLEALRKRQDGLRQKSGGAGPQNASGESGDFGTQQEDEKLRDASAMEVTANSSLSEYLAYCMLGQATLIDVSKFPGSGDSEAILDAMLEAYYQNPLILGISGYKINNKGTMLKLYYEEEPGKAAEKQEAIRRKVTEVTGKIITPGMTDLEKELAINQYLCDTIEYDMDALENAEQYDYAKTDPEFRDSFTAYGALLGGRCVCAGYASAFKLLADEAGLESIVVTGMLEGTMSHAWNKVKIDGKWEVIDATNNDNAELFNALLNIPGDASRRALVEDKLYVLDEKIADYAVEGEDQNEYYHLNDKFFPTTEIAKQLAGDLADDGKATLRTDYALTDGGFLEIADEVYKLVGDDVDLSGYFWMGVIYLEKV